MSLARLATGAAAAFALTASAPAGAAPTVVTLSFDDQSSSQLTARRMLAEHGMHATFFVNSGNVDKGPHMTWSDLTAVAADGNEIGGHTITHADLTKLSATRARTEVCNDRSALQAHGFDPVSFAYPFGRFNASVETIVAGCGYRTARTTTVPDAFAEPIPPTDPFALHAAQNDATLPLSTLQGLVTAAESNGGGWVQILFHDVCDGCDPLAVSPATLQGLLDWLAPRAANGTVVRTTRQVMDGDIAPPAPPASPPAPPAPPAPLPAASNPAPPPALASPAVLRAPALSTLSLSPVRIHRSARRRLTLTYRLDRQALVRVRVQRKVRGRYRTVSRTVQRRGRRGINHLRLSRSLLSRKPGTYRLAAVAIDQAGRRSRASHVRFRLLR